MKFKALNIFVTASMALTAAAQDLKTEVVVDRTVEPAERAATRLGGLTPVSYTHLTLPTIA